ncbi:MAG TPA: type II toxin-antitoxin system VapC family toxin [Conexibacter sp.]|nr:type II toxin-antitoxin system VapC family toxin [Conexibacter sp.]
MSSAVLDASALLAYLRDEPGADSVADAVAGGAAISTVNLGEVFSRVADRGADPVRVARQMTDRGLLDGAITVEAFTSADAVEVGRLRPLTREHGLSLGDRACLALARRLALPAVTADTAWSKLDLKLELRQIR